MNSWIDSFKTDPENEGRYLVLTGENGEVWVDIVWWEASECYQTLENGDVLIKKTGTPDWKIYSDQQWISHWMPLPSTEGLE